MADLPAGVVIDFFPDPMLIVDDDATVIEANRAADVLFGTVAAGQPLAALSDTSPADILAFIRRCSGSTAPLPGRLDRGDRRLRAYGARMREPNPERLIGLRIALPPVNEFALLSRKIDELNAEINQRRRTQALLEESVSEKLVLLRELHHRVKNNIQFILGMFSARRREPGPPELHHFLDVASRRLMSIGTVQQLMYQAEEMGNVDAAEFVQQIAAAVASTFDAAIRVDVSADEGRINSDKAFALSLILNELMTNAAKHGTAGGGTVTVGFWADGPTGFLTVADQGPGMDASALPGRASGLALVRGLCRQANAAIEFAGEDGLVVTVRFDLEPGESSR